MSISSLFCGDFKYLKLDFINTELQLHNYGVQHGHITAIQYITEITKLDGQKWNLEFIKWDIMLYYWKVSCFVRTSSKITS